MNEHTVDDYAPAHPVAQFARRRGKRSDVFPECTALGKADRQTPVDRYRHHRRANMTFLELKTTHLGLEPLWKESYYAGILEV